MSSTSLANSGQYNYSAVAGSTPHIPPPVLQVAPDTTAQLVHFGSSSEGSTSQELRGNGPPSANWIRQIVTETVAEISAQEESLHLVPTFKLDPVTHTGPPHIHCLVSSHPTVSSNPYPHLPSLRVEPLASTPKLHLQRSARPSTLALRPRLPDVEHAESPRNSCSPRAPATPITPRTGLRSDSQRARAQESERGSDARASLDDFRPISLNKTKKKKLRLSNLLTPTAASSPYSQSPDSKQASAKRILPLEQTPPNVPKEESCDNIVPLQSSTRTAQDARDAGLKLQYFPGDCNYSISGESASNQVTPSRLFVKSSDPAPCSPKRAGTFETPGTSGASSLSGEVPLAVKQKKKVVAIPRYNRPTRLSTLMARAVLSKPKRGRKKRIVPETAVLPGSSKAQAIEPIPIDSELTLKRLPKGMLPTVLGDEDDEDFKGEKPSGESSTKKTTGCSGTPEIAGPATRFSARLVRPNGRATAPRRKDACEPSRSKRIARRVSDSPREPPSLEASPPSTTRQSVRSSRPRNVTTEPRRKRKNRSVSPQRDAPPPKIQKPSVANQLLDPDDRYTGLRRLELSEPSSDSDTEDFQSPVPKREPQRKITPRSKQTTPKKCSDEITPASQNCAKRKARSARKTMLHIDDVAEGLVVTGNDSDSDKGEEEKESPTVSSQRSSTPPLRLKVEAIPPRKKRKKDPFPERMFTQMESEELSTLRIAFIDHYEPPPSNLQAQARFERIYKMEMTEGMIQGLWENELKPWSNRWWDFYSKFNDMAREKKKEKPRNLRPTVRQLEAKHWAQEFFDEHGPARIPTLDESGKPMETKKTSQSESDCDEIEVAAVAPVQHQGGKSKNDASQEEMDGNEIEVSNVTPQHGCKKQRVVPNLESDGEEVDMAANVPIQRQCGREKKCASQEQRGGDDIEVVPDVPVQRRGGRRKKDVSQEKDGDVVKVTPVRRGREKKIVEPKLESDDEGVVVHKKKRVLRKGLKKKKGARKLQSKAELKVRPKVESDDGGEDEVSKVSHGHRSGPKKQKGARKVGRKAVPKVESGDEEGDVSTATHFKRGGRKTRKGVSKPGSDSEEGEVVSVASTPQSSRKRRNGMSKTARDGEEFESANVTPVQQSSRKKSRGAPKSAKGGEEADTIQRSGRKKGIQKSLKSR